MLSDEMAGVIRMRNQQRIDVNVFGLVFETFGDLALTCLLASLHSATAHGHTR